MDDSLSDLGSAHEWATHWAQRWFLDDQGRDRLRLPPGIDGGWATHVEAHEALVRVALREMGRGTRHPADTSLLGRLKASGIDRAIRAWGLRALALTGVPKVHRRGVAAIVEIPTPSALGSLNVVALSLPAEARSLAAADPRASRSWRRSGLAPYNLVLSLLDERRALAAGRRATAVALDAVQASPPTMRLGGQDLTRRALSDLRSRLSHALPWLVPEALALRRFLDAVQPVSLALASDQHRIGRIAVELAGDTPAIVVQHGLPQARIGYLPVVATRVAVWSQASHEWFAGHGTPADRLVITGNPRFDELTRMDRDRVRTLIDTRLRMAGSPRLLLALSPTDVEVNTAVLRAALEAVAMLRGARLIVKLHPGHRGWGFVREQVQRSPVRDRVRIVHRDPLGPLLGWADVLLVHRSTVAAEALAAGTPVVLLAPDGQAPVPPELEDLALPGMRPGQLSADVLGDLSTADNRARFVAQRAAQIERLNGPMDGRAGERVAQLLLNRGDPASVWGPGQVQPPAGSTARRAVADATDASTPAG